MYSLRGCFWQVKLVRKFQLCAQEGKSLCHQMIMGAGKTTVHWLATISVPLAYSSGACLSARARIHMPSFTSSQFVLFAVLTAFCVTWFFCSGGGSFIGSDARCGVVFVPSVVLAWFTYPEQCQSHTHTHTHARTLFMNFAFCREMLSCSNFWGEIALLRK